VSLHINCCDPQRIGSTGCGGRTPGRNDHGSIDDVCGGIGGGQLYRGRIQCLNPADDVSRLTAR
jgi:hypothetical protein